MGKEQQSSQEGEYPVKDIRKALLERVTSQMGNQKWMVFYRLRTEKFRWTKKVEQSKREEMFEAYSEKNKKSKFMEEQND